MFRKLQRRKQSVDEAKVQLRMADPQNPFERCPSCGFIHELASLQQSLWVCDHCNHHFRLHIATRLQQVFDHFSVFDHTLTSTNPLDFPGYQEKLDALSETNGVYDAVVCGEATLDGLAVIGIVMDVNFMMGSMGTVVGEKISRAFERAQAQKKPLILFSASGGARMQEGIMSLMQMAKTAAVVSAFSEKGGLFINVLTDPTTGGVTASFAMLADIILAEPNALIGFAGPRVIKDTVKTELPPGFQRSEFLLETGFVDAIVPRHQLKDTLIKLLNFHGVKR